MPTKPTLGQLINHTGSAGTKSGSKTKTTKATAKPKLAKVPIYVQPSFVHSPLAQNISRPFGAGPGGDRATGGTTNQVFRRGFMVWDSNVPPPSGYDRKDPNYPAVVKFLFNPSTISTSYQVADGSAQAALNYGTTQGLDGGGLLLPIQQQTSFTLMFDRTYEMTYPSLTAGQTWANDIKNFGVDVDIAALRQFTGMYAGVYSGNANFIPYTSSNAAVTTSGTSSSNPNQISKSNQPLGNLAQGVMQVTIGYCYFSGPTSPAVGGKGYGITYYGYIDSWSVEYTHFNQNMIPMRCVVDISFTFLPPPIKAPDTQGAAKIAASQGVTLGSLGNIIKRIAGAPINPGSTSGGIAGR
jgi:hypothetical protein